MNTYNSISVKYLVHQKKRAALTLLGIVLSVALVSAISTMLTSLLDNMIQQVKDEDGSFHFGYENVNVEFVKRLQAHTLIDSLGVVREGSTTKIARDTSLEVMYANSDALRLLPVRIVKGRLPAKAGEIAVEGWLMKTGQRHLTLGSKIAISTSPGLKDYRITGIMASSAASQYSGVGQAVALSDIYPSDSKYMVLAALREGIKVGEHLSGFKADTPNGSKFFTNQKLLSMLRETEDGSANLQLNLIIAFLVGLTVIATVAVIYNAFQISVLERMKQFGLLMAMGATPRQIGRIVINEATVLAVIGIPLGVVVGLGGLQLVIWLMGSGFLTLDRFMLVPKPVNIVGSAVVGFVAVYLSAALPAVKASKVSPLDAIRRSGSIRKEKVRNSFLSRVFGRAGIGAAMAFRNLNRNRTKFRITSFSVGISVVIMIVFNYFTGRMMSEVAFTNESAKLDFTISRRVVDANPASEGVIGSSSRLASLRRPSFDEEVYKKLSRTKGVRDVYRVYDLQTVSIMVPEAKLGHSYASLVKETPELRKTFVKRGESLWYPLKATIEICDSERLSASRKYIKSGETEDSDSVNGVMIVQKSRVFNPAKKKNMLLNVIRFEPGDTIETAGVNGSGSILKATAVMKAKPFGADSSYGHSIWMMVPLHVYKNAFKVHPPITGFEIELKEGADRAPVKKMLNTLQAKDPSIYIVDNKEHTEELAQFTFQMRVFVYGFLLVIGLISSLNIINTISTNLILRQKEFAALRAIGMSMRQIKNMVRTEGVLYGAFGALYGSIIGVVLCNLLYRPMNNVRGFEWEAPIGSVIVAFAGAVAVGLLSVVLPLRRIDNYGIADALRMDD